MFRRDVACYVFLCTHENVRSTSRPSVILREAWRGQSPRHDESKDPRQVNPGNSPSGSSPRKHAPVAGRYLVSAMKRVGYTATAECWWEVTRMRYLVLQFLLLSTVAFADHDPASCQISDKSVVSHSPSGFTQVSNLELIQIRCNVAARSWPLQPGIVRNGLKAGTTAHKISSDGTTHFVPSEVNVSGGGSDGTVEWVNFYIHIPLALAERNAEIRRYLANLQRSLPDKQSQERIRHLQRHPQAVAAIITQNRAGRFQVDCRVLDGDLVIGVGRVGLEVLFKGRFSDAVSREK